MKPNNNELYEASLKDSRGFLWRALYGIWLVVGLTALFAIAWSEPWSDRLFAKMIAAGVSSRWIDFALAPLIMSMRAILLVEAVGYIYHRFFQHVGWFTRRAQVFRRNQRYHWIHHMIIYPIGRFYRMAREYVAAEGGVGLSWVIPGLLVAAMFIITHGFNLGSLVFVVVVASYAKYIIDRTHSRFHEVNHPWTQSAYFQWLEKIHLLHHWDQRTNFTIVHPLMDMLFGTYLSPATHEAQLSTAVQDEELTVSDMINWRYLLVEATPAEYGAFVSAARQHPRSVRKIGKLMVVLQERIAAFPDDAQAKDLLQKAKDLLAAIENSRREPLASR